MGDFEFSTNELESSLRLTLADNTQPDSPVSRLRRARVQQFGKMLPRGKSTHILDIGGGCGHRGGSQRRPSTPRLSFFARKRNDLTEVCVIDVKKLLRTHNLQEDVHWRSGDMIFVPQHRISKISRYLPTSSLGLFAYPGTF